MNEVQAYTMLTPSFVYYSLQEADTVAGDGPRSPPWHRSPTRGSGDEHKIDVILQS